MDSRSTLQDSGFLTAGIAPGRRRALQALGAVGMMALLGGCGFALRGTADLPFKTLYVNLEDTSDLGAQLRQLCIQCCSLLLPLDASGRVREFELRYLFTFRLHNGKGYEFIRPTTIMLKRDLTFNDAATLAKESEANLLYRDMQMEVIQQLLRRMAAVEPV